MHLVRTSLIVAVVALLAGCERTAFHEDGGDLAESPNRARVSDAAIRDSVRQVMDRALRDSAFPGAVAVVGRRAGVVALYPVGRLDWAAGSPVTDEHTMYDMASLTKVVGMTSGLMQLVAAGKIDLNAPVQKYLPAWTGRHKERVLVRHLSTHTAGLPADEPYDRVTHDPDSVAKLMFGTPLDTDPGARVVYSDIGAYMLGRVVEQVTDQSLDVYLHDHVFEPAGMHESMFRPPVALYPRIAPTEYDSVQRRRLIRGMVHDERAYYLGGVSAHAGLFSSAHDVARFCRMMLNGGEIDGTRVIPAATIAQFTKRQVEDRALGWQKPDGKNSAGHKMPEEAYGHTGFTGTSIWIDPKDDVFIVLLSNRVDPTRNNNRIGRYRVQLADAVMSVILSSNPSR
jgi:CubicO group peptidase (beta-lactamase class C family)